MYVTPLNFRQVLSRFYNQGQYDFLLLFVSSFDGNDKKILQDVLANANRIDRITGKSICFFYFIGETYDQMNEKIVRWIKNISDYTPLYGTGVRITMETADDIRRHFNLLRSELPSFLLVDRHTQNASVYPINDYTDFELFLSPINILHSYIEDKNDILSNYEASKQKILSDYLYKRKKTVVTQADVLKRKSERGTWEAEIRRLKRKKNTLPKTDTYAKEQIDMKISELYDKINANPMIVINGEDMNVPYPKDELDKVVYPSAALSRIKELTLNKLKIHLTSGKVDEIISCLDDQNVGYSQAIRMIVEDLKSKKVRMSNTLANIRNEIATRGFDVFISCKSQDYTRARDLYYYLKENGYKPFLADASLKEIGIDQYTALIGEVIDGCQYMVVFASDKNYIETSYVMAEWNSFVNDINSGSKPNAKIFTVLSPDININELPLWLRDKQSFTTDNYKESLVQFLRGPENLY